MLELCALAEKLGNSMFLLGTGSQDVLDKAVIELKKKFADLKIAGTDPGPKINIQYPMLVPSEVERSNIKNSNIVDSSRLIRNASADVVSKINATKPDILFVAFGQVKQEKWINEYLLQMPSVKIAMGVGGAIDYISGNVSRAPLFLRKIGLEWLWRLMRQPTRWKRILNATFKFLFIAVFSKKI